jgi:hypothetical protein
VNPLKEINAKRRKSVELEESVSAKSGEMQNLLSDVH